MTDTGTPNSARPAMTADLMARTGLDDALLKRLVHTFYDRVRDDPLLAPIFAEHITDWGAHLAKMVDFWSSVALMTGRYHGAPMARHVSLPVETRHFNRWLDLFRDTAAEICPPAGADWLVERAERIALSMHTTIGAVRRQAAINAAKP